jgi:hypothetical protein
VTGREPRYDPVAIADRVDLESLHGKFAVAGVMVDYDRFVWLFTLAARASCPHQRRVRWPRP